MDRTSVDAKRVLAVILVESVKVSYLLEVMAIWSRYKSGHVNHCKP